MKDLITNFLNGLLIVVPTTASLYVIFVIFDKIDGIIPLPVPGLGFLVTIGLITAVGAFASNVVGRKLVEWADALLGRVPLVKLIYHGIKDFMSALVGDKKSFDRPCLVSLDAEGNLRTFGFITKEDLSHWGIEGLVAVYMPQSINFAGQLALVPRERVKPLDVEASEVLPFVVSGGVTG